MTKEEALKELNELREYCEDTFLKRTQIPYLNALDMAIKAIEQEPCEDVVSRKAVLDSLHNKFADGFDSDRWWNSMSVLYAINKVPPVTPKPKTGHWIIIDDCEQFIAKCSECGAIVDSRMANNYPYCHCGAKMDSEAEE